MEIPIPGKAIFILRKGPDDKPSAAPMMTQFPDTYMHRQAWER